MKDHESKSGKVESQLVKERAGTSASVLADILRALQRALLSGALQACSTPLPI